MLKRRIYWFVFGVIIVSHFSLAAINNDCAECGPPQSIPFPSALTSLPIKQNLMAGLTSFSSSNSLSNYKNVSSLQQELVAAQAKADAAEKREQQVWAPLPKRPQLSDYTYFSNGFPKPSSSSDLAALQIAYRHNDIRAIMGVVSTYMPASTWEPFGGYVNSGYASPFPTFY